MARIALGHKEKFYLGNLDARRDWGHAKDYVRMMWMILQAEKAEDWVIATGVSKSVRQMVVTAFDFVGIELEFYGKGKDEKGIVKSCKNNDYQLEIGKEVLSIDPNYYRPTEVDYLIGDPTKAKKQLGWIPEYNFNALVNEMMESDLKLFNKK